MAENPPPIQNQRKVTDLEDLPRSAFGSHRVRAREAAAPPNHPPLSSFSPSALFDWLRSYLSYAFHRKHDFPAASASRQNAIYDLGGSDGSEVRIALAGDWATGTDEACAVMNQMQAFMPDITLHIGDIYYVGDEPEVNENCLGIKNPNNNYDPVTWPIGARGSFALNGNHEMYANGNAYFDIFLPKLGLKNPDGSMGGQQTSFFCLENKYWRIIAIDTGYNSIGIPILSQIPWINEIPGVGGDCKLPKPLTDWLAKQVNPQSDQRAIVLLSHHQYYSGFELQYRKPAQQLFKAGVNRPVLWFWGHEHRLAAYSLFGNDDLKCHGRCVGHGGMPVERGAPSKDPKPIYYDDRFAPNSFGMNGHVNLTFRGAQLTATYVDLNGKALVEELWEAQADGSVKSVSIKKLIDDPNFYFDVPVAVGLGSGG